MTLLDRLRAATEGSAELDLDVLNAISQAPAWYWLDRDRGTITRDKYGPGAVGNPICGLEALTTSVDAALGLVPDGWWWGIVKTGKDGTMQAAASGGSTDLEWHEASTAPLAICCAALEARGIE